MLIIFCFFNPVGSIIKLKWYECNNWNGRSEEITKIQYIYINHVFMQLRLHVTDRHTSFIALVSKLC